MGLNWKKLLFGLSVGVGMTMMPACSNDDGYDTDGNGQGKEVVKPTETGYLSTGVSLGTLAGTPKSGDPGTEVGLPSEQAVRAVRLVLYGADSNIVEYAWDLGVTNNDASDVFIGSDVSTETASSLNRFVTVGRAVAKKNYKMLVLVNPMPLSVASTQEGCSIDLIQSMVCDIKKKADGGLTNSDAPIFGGYFSMTNAQGMIDVPASAIRSSQKEAEQQPVSIQVERMVAKVTLDTKNMPTLPNGDKLLNCKWDLDVTNLRYYPMRRMTYLSGGGTMERTGDGSERYDRYAEDPNFTRESQWENSSITRKQFEYFDSFQPYPTFLEHSFEENSTNYAYVSENTMATDAQYQHITTRVVLAGNYEPNIPFFNKGEGFFTFAGYSISEYMMELYAYSEYIDEPFVSLGLKDAISIVKGRYGDNIFRRGVLTFPFLSSGLNYYYKGICYYTILIRHFNDSQVPDKMGYGRYGVVRNNVYKLTINNINGPGRPVYEEPGAEPNDGNTSISANILVLPWQIRKQTVEELK